MKTISAEIESLLAQGNMGQAIDLLINSLVENPANDILLQIKESLENNVSGNSKEKLELYNKFNTFFPTTFTIETSLACNLKCPECAIGADMISRKKGYLKYENYLHIAEKIKPFAKYLYLHLWGEPMLNKKIIEMVKHASTFCRTNISTNATILTQEKAEALIASNVSEVIISIDGFTQDVYEKYRVGGKVDDAFKGLQYLIDANKKHGNKTQLYPQFIVFKHNQHEVRDFAQYVQSLGLRPEFKAPYIRQTDGNFSVSDYQEYRRTEYDTEAELKHAMSDCVNPKEVFTINLDGSVVVCCHDYDNITKFGNIYENDVLEIWNSPQYRKFRWDIFRGEAPQFCVDYCMTYVPSANMKKSTKPEPKKHTDMKKVNLCSGSILLEDFVNIDIYPAADIVLDLEKELIPFEDNSVDELACISAINYFDKKRGQEIINDVFRVLKPGGVARFATQDLKMLANYYVSGDMEFFFQKGQNGQDRFPGKTMADKFNNWFYGFESQGKYCKFVYDYETLALMFEEAGFGLVEQKEYLDSRISNVEKLDNRPEQMFFLEAVKQEVKIEETKKDSTESLKENKTKLTEWTSLMYKDEYGSISQQEFDYIYNALLENQRYDDLVKLLKKYAGTYMGFETVATQIADFTNRSKNKHKDSAKTQQNLQKLMKYNQPNPETKGDQEHLDAAMNWLYNAAKVNGFEGISAMYDPVNEDWLVSYPETTGYIIPNLVSYARFSGRTEFMELAEKAGQWEIDIQWQDGGVGEPFAVYGQKPRVFNTSQVMLGWLSLLNATKNEKYLVALKKAANWLVDIQEKEGYWSKHTYQGPRSYHVRTAWVMLEMFYITNDERYADSVENFMNWAITLVNNNGWIEQTSLTDPAKPWTHLTGYTLTGMLKFAELLQDTPFRETVVGKLGEAAKNIKQYYNSNPLVTNLANALPGTFDRNWQSTDAWSCITGDAQIEYFMRKMGNMVPELELIDTANKMLDSLKTIQVMDSPLNPEMQGGLFGSYPVQGEYCAFSVPNWGVKFMADSLIQRIGFELDHFLG